MGRFLCIIFALILLISLNWGCTAPKKASTGQQQEVFTFIKKSGDQTAELSALINRRKNLTIRFEKNKTYNFSEVIFSPDKNIILEGENTTVMLSDKAKVKNLFTVNSPRSFQVTGITFDGNYKKSATTGYLIEVNTRTSLTGNVRFENCSFTNGSNGLLLIKKQRETQLKAKTDEKTIVKNCNFSNPGLYSAINIRGSHQDVLIENCVGTDDLGRQHYAGGKMFEVTDEVGGVDSYVKRAVIKDCRIENAPKGFYAQKIKDFLFVGCTIDGLGKNETYYPNGKTVGIVGLKIDDLGLNGKAIIDNFTQKNTAKNEYQIAVSLEESGTKEGRTQNVIIRNSNLDSAVRLAASGDNLIENTKLTQGKIAVKSTKNKINHCSFYDYIGVGLSASDNEISNCKFYNSGINIYPAVQNTSITNCQLFDAVQRDCLVLVELNNPQIPNQITVKNCTVPPKRLGIRAGGVPKQAKNMSIMLDLKNQDSFPLHDNIKQNSKISTKKNR